MRNTSAPDTDARVDTTIGVVLLLLAIAIAVFSFTMVQDIMLFYVLLALAVFLVVCGGRKIYVWRG